MDRQDWFEVGSQIGDLVQSAIDSKNFQQLNQSITDTINSAVEAMQNSMSYGSNAGRDTIQRKYRSEKSAYQMAREDVEASSPKRAYTVSKKTPRVAGNGKGLAFMGVGYSFAGLFGMAFLVFSWLSSFTGMFGFSAILFLLLTIGFLFMGVKGTRLNARSKRQKQYLNIMGERDTCTIDELAAGTGKSKQYVVKDLKSMIQDGMFPDGAYLDTFETCLMTSHSAYQQYQDVTRRYEQRKEEEAKSQARRKETEGARAELSEEVRKILKEGEEFIRHIHRANDAIEDKDISDKLDRLEGVVTRIFTQVEKDPKSAPDLHKLMSYYLPITQKLVDAYEELDAQEVAGENIRKTKKEIEASLDTINTAFENLLDSFFQDTAWDISSDISVLRTMMAQDGLMKKDFATGEKIKTVAGDIIGKDGQAQMMQQGQAQAQMMSQGQAQAQTISQGKAQAQGQAMSQGQAQTMSQG